MKKYDANQLVNNKDRLIWACRRGMLELDVLLGNFLKHSYDEMSIEDKHLFVRLLETPDPDLFAWLMGNVSAEDEQLQYMVDKIRHDAQSRF